MMNYNMKEVKDLKDRVFLIYFSEKQKGFTYNKIILLSKIADTAIAITKGLKANEPAYKSSKIIYGEEYEFGYDQFIQNSIEDRLASLYVFLIFMRDEIDLKKQKRFHFNFSDRIFILHKIVEFCMNEQYPTAIAVVETLAKSMGIDLSYYVDALLLNLMYKHKIGINHGNY